jgi:hypothetical protein
VATNDIIVRAQTGGTNDVQVYTPATPSAPPRYDIVINDPAGSPDQFILVFAPGQGDGVPSHRNAALIGQSAITGFSSFTYPVQLTGLSATATAGVLQDVFLLDNFTTGSIVLSSHQVDTPPGNAWNLQTPPSVGAFPAISSGRLVPNDSADFWQMDTNPFAKCPYPNADALPGDFFIEAMYRYAGNNSNRMLAVVASQSGAANGYYMGWNDQSLQWEIGTCASGALNSIATDTTAAFSGTVGQLKKIRLEIQQAGANFFGQYRSPTILQGYVDDVLVIDTSDVSPVTVDSGLVGILGGDPLGGLGTAHSCEMDWVRAGPITRLLTGLQVVATAGTATGSISGGSSSSATGLRATTAQGIIIPEVQAKPLGRAATTAQGTLVPDLGAGVGFLVGQVATTAQGLLKASLAVGASAGGLAFLPSIQMNFVTRSFPGGAGYKPLTNAPISVNGVLRGTYDDVGAPALTSAYDPGVQGFRRYVKKDGSASFTPSATQETGEYNPWYRSNIVGGKLLPNGEEFDYEIFGGGHFSVDRDRQLHWVHSRAFAFKDPNWVASGDATHFRPRWGDPLYVYQSDYNIAQDTRNGQEIDHSLPYAFARSNVYFDKNREHLIGLYAHDQHNVWMFYPEPYTSPFAFNGMRVTTRQGTLAPFTQGQAQALGAAATTRQGALGAKVDGAPLLTGLRATTAQGALLRDDPVNIVPAYARGDGYQWDTTHQVLLKDFTGATVCFALRDYMTVVRSGYGDVVYLVYLSGTNADKYTAAYVGVIVLDVVTGKVYSHTLTAITGSRPSGYADSVSRSVADVCKMSTGTSVTQFTMNGWIFHLTWNSGTYTAPTVTQKTAPSVPSGMTAFLPGFESFDYKGDEAYHALFSHVITGSSLSGFTIHMRVTYNDATGTGSSWTTPTVDTFSALLPSGSVVTFGGYSGYGEALATWMLAYWFNAGLRTYPIGEGVDEPADVGGLFNSSGASLAFNYKAFANQQPYLSSTAEGRVGTVSVTIIQGTSTALTGLRATTAAGTFSAVSIAVTDRRVIADFVVEGAGYEGPLTDVPGVPYEGAHIPELSDSTWGGLRAYTRQGIIFFSVPGFGDLNPGLRITGAQGALIPAIDKALTGQLGTSTAGTIVPSISVALTGQAATTAAGTLTPSMLNTIALTGLQIVTTPGTVTTDMANVGSPLGRAATATAGTIVPTNNPVLTGSKITASAGQLGINLGPTLTGVRLTLAQGVTQILLEIALTGRSTTATRGLISISADCIVNARGVFATGVVGIFTTDVPPIPPDHQLWAHSEVAKLFTQDDDNELYNVSNPARN